MGLLDSITGGDILKSVTSFAGGAISGITGKSAQKREYERQKEFAQNGIRWKVADAKAAGIHPIYAIGANTPTYSPQAAVGNDYGLSQMGQDIGRAIEAKQSRIERLAAQRVQERLNEAQIANIESQTEQHKAQTDAIRQGIYNDALFNNPDYISQMAHASQHAIRTLQSQPPIPNMDPTINEYGFSRSPDGKIRSVVPGDSMAQRTEDRLIIEWIPWIGAAIENLKARLFGTPVAGHYWHGEDKGFLPYPPAKTHKKTGIYDYQSHRPNPYR